VNEEAIARAELQSQRMMMMRMIIIIIIIIKIEATDFLLGHAVRGSVRMEQLGSHWTDFYEIWYLCIFRNSV
jgi:hypothetical protein